MAKFLKFLLSLAFLVSTPSALACLQCEVWWGTPVCGPNHQVGGYSCWFIYDPDLGLDTCITIGACSNGNPPWRPDPGLFPTGKDEQSTLHSACQKAITDPSRRPVSFSLVSGQQPTVVKLILSLLQPAEGLLLVPPHFEGVIASRTPKLQAWQDLSSDQDAPLHFEGGFILQESGHIAGVISLSGAIGVSELLIELEPRGHEASGSRKEPEAGKTTKNADYAATVTVIR